MKIETKFSNGDKVFHIVNKPEAKIIPCSFCAGNRKIKGADGKERFCPECSGNGGVTKWLPTKWQVERKLTIGQVRAEITVKWEGISDTFSNFGAQKYEHEETYMCSETGIKSGSVYDGNNLFASREEAQAECDRRNEEGK